MFKSFLDCALYTLSSVVSLQLMYTHIQAYNTHEPIQTAGFDSRLKSVIKATIKAVCILQITVGVCSRGLTGTNSYSYYFTEFVYWTLIHIFQNYKFLSWLCESLRYIFIIFNTAYSHVCARAYRLHNCVRNKNNVLVFTQLRV